MIAYIVVEKVYLIKKEHRLRVLENGEGRKIFPSKREIAKE